jgi:hypothetical protein
MHGLGVLLHVKQMRLLDINIFIITYVQGHESDSFENETIKTTIKSWNSFICVMSSKEMGGDMEGLY